MALPSPQAVPSPGCCPKQLEIPLSISTRLLGCALSIKLPKETPRKTLIYSPILLNLVSQIFSDICLYLLIMYWLEQQQQQQLTGRGSADIYKPKRFLSCALCYQLNLST